MQKALCSLSLFPLLLSGFVSLAQNSILAGKITDENNNPVANAMINLSDNPHHVVSAQTDSNGLYYTKEPLCEGFYTITITANGKQNNADGITIPAHRVDKDFCNFQLTATAARLTITNRDPFMEAKLAATEAEFPLDATENSGTIFTDSTGKVIKNYSSRRFMPLDKP